jgi:hypothetical protein
MKIFIAGAWHEVSRRFAFIGGSWRRVTRRLIYIDGAWNTAARFLDPLSVSVSPPSASATVSSHLPAVGTVYVSATPAGGLAPYTYAWGVIPDIGPPPTVGAPTSANTYAYQSIPSGTQYESSLQVTVTDSLGQTASATCPCTFINEG